MLRSTAMSARPSSFRNRVKPPAKGSIEFGKWYRMKIVVRGKQIQCFIDDELIQAAKFNTSRSGSIGLGGFQSMVEFKEIQVTAPYGKVLLKAFHAN